ncbi:MAG: EAL domain-containing protein [Acidimicrobiales bacterium]|nr:EAL domain-containing protein [Acidimicrobiales bacterium]
MGATLTGTERVRLWVTLGACAFTGAALLLAVWLAAEAFEERRSASAASDLRFAALTVSAADAAPATTSVTTAGVGEALEVLSGDRDRALHSLTPSERERAEQLLDEIAGCAVMLLDPEAEAHDPHGHDELQLLLAHAADTAADDAATAEGRAMGAVVVALVGLAITGWLLMRARYRAARDRELAAAARRLQALVNDSPDMFVLLAPSGEISYRSPSVDRVLGPECSTIDDVVALAEPADQAGLREQLHHTVGRSAKVFSLATCEGDRGWFETRVSDLTDEPLVAGRLLTLHDITKEVELRDDLVRQASTDVLTGLPNRRALEGILEHARTDLATSGSMVAFLTLDLDGFKQINDTLGHLAGDEVLTHVARRLTGTLRADQAVVRLGGDEFAVVLRSTNPRAARRHADRLLRVLDDPFPVGGRTEHLRTSIGMALTAEPECVSTLVSEADIAMYQAKRSGGHTVVVYEPTMEEGALATSRIARALRSAAYDDEFHLVYQPVVTTDGATVIGYEALLRWTSPTLGTVRPDEFIPVAEASGEICSIGKWVLATICRHLTAGPLAGLDPSVTVSFNVSARELAETGFVSCVLDSIRGWGLAVERLVVEVTETSVLDNTGVARQRLEALRAAGLRIAIDDFGSGYSNLGQLLSIPFDIIKIDRSLLLTLSSMREQAGGDPAEPCAIMEAIVSIADVLQAKVLCEGVETPIQARSLERSGIPYVQGYLFGRPQPPEEIAAQLPAATTEFA